MGIDQETEQQLNDQLNGIENNADDQHQDNEDHVGQTDDGVDENLEQDESGGAPPRQESRAEARIRRQQEENARLRAENEFFKRQSELAQQQQLQMQRQQQEEVLDPDERWRRSANEQLQRATMLAADANDRTAFLTKFSKDPDVLAMQSEIEAKLAEARSQGHNPPRENILTYLLGQKALEQRSKAPAVRKAAADRVQAAKGQPLGSKSNVAASKSVPGLRERLKDVPL